VYEDLEELKDEVEWVLIWLSGIRYFNIKYIMVRNDVVGCRIIRCGVIKYGMV
jgi:hypothetical protein